MSSALSVSVAIATYNGIPYVAEQLRSIAAQTHLPDEVVVSDDGSSDETASVVEQAAAMAAFPIRLLRQPRRLGILENFYAAFAACSGDVIVYCDQDDIWLPTKLARQIAALADGAALAIHPSEVVDADLHTTGVVSPRNPRAGRLAFPVDAGSIYAYGHQMAFRREVLAMMLALRELAERQPSGRGHNFDVYIPSCASLVGPIEVLTEPLVKFRRHERATTAAGHRPVERQQAIGARAAGAIAHAREGSSEMSELVAEAAAQRLISADQAARLRGALAHAITRSKCQARVAEARRISAIARLPEALLACARPTGFSNDRRAHQAALTIAALAR